MYFQMEVARISQALQLNLHRVDGLIDHLPTETLDGQRAPSQDTPLLIAQLGKIDRTERSGHGKHMLQRVCGALSSFAAMVEPRPSIYAPHPEHSLGIVHFRYKMTQDRVLRLLSLRKTKASPQRFEKTRKRIVETKMYRFSCGDSSDTALLMGRQLGSPVEAADIGLPRGTRVPCQVAHHSFVPSSGYRGTARLPMVLA